MLQSVLFSGVAKVVLSYQSDSREPNFSRAALWTTVHLYTGILCANLPTSRPLFNQVGRLGSGSREKLLSLGKRWYSMSTRTGTDNRDSMSRGKPGDHSRGYNRAADVEGGQVDYELGMYYRDGQIIDDSAKLVHHSSTSLPRRN